MHSLRSPSAPGATGAVRPRNQGETAGPEQWAAGLDLKAGDLDLKAVDLDPKAVDLDPKALDLDPKAVDLDPKAVDLDPKAVDLDLKAVDLDLWERSPDRDDPAVPCRHSRSAPRGLTLIELVVALAIIAVLFGAVATSLGAITGSRAKAAAGELGGVIRSLYDTAALKGRTCRLVFQLPDKDAKEDQAGDVRYWAECAEGHVTTSRDRDQALEDANHAAELAARDQKEEASHSLRLSKSSGSSDEPLSTEEQAAQEKAKVEKRTRFSQYTSEEIAPRGLSGVTIKVWTQHQRDPVTSGLAYLYFFPQGYTEKAYVYFEQGKNVWTITVAPLTGKTTIVSRELKVPRS